MLRVLFVSLLLTLGGAVLAMTAAPFAASASAQAELDSLDWPQWRGPARDGAGAAASWEGEPERVWSAAVGIGHASPVVSGSTVYQFSRRGQEEVLAALALDSGTERWRSGYAAPYRMHPAATGHGEGPKSTPAVADGRVFTLGIDGTLTAFDAAGDGILWQRRFDDRFPATSPIYGAAMSPLVLGELVIAHVGGHRDGALAAFAVDSGEIRWELAGDGPGYASPVVAAIDGVEQLVTQTDARIVGVRASDGELLWSLPFRTDYDQNSVTPLVLGDRIVVSGLDHGVFAIEPRRDGSGWEVAEAWRNRDVSMYMSSPVLSEGRLFGFSHRRAGQFFALDPDDGSLIWSSRGREGENAGLLALGDRVVFLTDGARLLAVAAPSVGAAAAEVAVAADHEVAPSATWAHPTPVPDGLLVKDLETLSRLRWSDDGP